MRGVLSLLLLIGVVGVTSGRAHAASQGFAWDYNLSSGQTGQSGFQFLRCTAPLTGDCVPTTLVTSSPIAAAIRVWTDTTLVAGSRYCWGNRAIQAVGAPSDLSGVVCETIATPVLIAPTNLRKAASGAMSARKAHR
jgi:hypothetical protein